MKDSEYNNMLETLKEQYNANIWYDNFNPNEIESKKHLSLQYEIPGNHHWGNQTDIIFLQKQLKIKIILVDKDRFWSVDKLNYEYVLLIYYIEDYHYQLGGIKINNENKISSIFKSSDLTIKKIIRFFNL